MKRKQTGSLASRQNAVVLKTVVRLGEMMYGDPNLDRLIVEQLSEIFSCRVNLFVKTPQLQVKSTPPLIQKVFQFRSIACLDHENCPIVYRKAKISNLPLDYLITEVAFPIKFHGNTLGAIALTRENGEYFTAEEIELFEPIGTQIAIAIKSREKVQQNTSSDKTINLLQKTSDLLVNCSTIQDLAENVCNSILSYLEVVNVKIFSWESTTENLNVLATASNEDFSQNVSIPEESLGFPRQNIVDACARLGKEVSINSGSKTRRSKNKELDNSPSLNRVALPIKIYDRVLGVLELGFCTEKVNPEKDFVILRSVAVLLAMGFENNRLDTDVTRRISLMESVSKVSNAVTSILEEAELFKEVINALQEYLDYPFVQIFSVHTGRRKVFFRSGKTKLKKNICYYC